MASAVGIGWKRSRGKGVSEREQRRDLRVLLLFPSQSYRVDSFLLAAERAGVDLWLGTDLPGAFERHGRPVVAVDFHDPEGAARAIADASARAPLAGVVGTNETSAVVAALAAERLGLPSSSAEGARAARDKRR